MAFAFTIAIPLLLVRRMPQHEFGLYKQIFLITNSAVTVLPLGFGLTAYYFLPRDARFRNQTVFNVVLFTTAVATLFAAVLSLFPSLLTLLFNEPEAVRYAPWIGTVIVLWVLGSFLEIVTVANEEIKIATFVILGNQITRATFFLTAAIISGTVWALVLAAICQGIAQVAALLWYLHSRFRGFWRQIDFSFFRQQLAYALPFGAAGTLWSLEFDLHNYFVSHQFGPAVYAIYAVGCFQVPLFGILGDSVGAVMLPQVSLLQHEQRTRDIIILSARAMRKLAAVYLPAYVFLLVMRREFVVGLFTARYLESIPIFAINLSLIPLGILVVDPIMRAYAEHRHFLLKLHSVTLALMTIALAVCVKPFGLIGAISLMVGFTYLARAATVVKVIRILGVTARDVVLLTDVFKLVISVTVAGLVTTFARSLTSSLPPLVALAIGGVIFGITYVTAALAAGVVSPDERELVAGYFSRVMGRSAAPLVDAATLVQD